MSIDIRSLFDLSNRVDLVTGGGVGLGREFCQVLAEFGADVIICARTREDLENTCEIISKYGHKTLALKVDVSDYAQVQKMFE
jgi:NAD(P)-dependent dehydrogenase (short-subunit alcohol dehydrogenase family)